ncbi:MAG: DUF5666 domain-containing protein [Rhizobacter sp.]|nr:DUF5666 domain-containing protein [Rhizobacter sp.]
MNTLLHRLAIGLCAATTALLVACGGGGSAGGSADSSSAVYQGTINGFGSVIVNGVRFDDSQARISIDDEAATAARLRLGMRAEVSGSVSTDGSTGTAHDVVIETAVRGAIASIDITNARFTIRGINVQTDAQTVFDGASSLATLKVGDWVEVHGSVNFENRVVQATRVEVKAPEEVGRVVLFGKASKVTETSFSLGDLSVSYDTARLIGFDGNLIPEGAVVRVRANQPPVGNVLVASVVKAVKAPRFTDGTPAAVEGRIQQFKGVADFLVSGTAVDASDAVFEHGVAADLSVGKRVVVRGTLSNGKLLASKVRFFRPDQDGEVRLIGIINDYVSKSSFTVRGVAVDASMAAFEGGDEMDLANGRLIDVRGESAGSVVKATRIRFGDATTTSGLATGVVSEFVSTAQFKLGGRDAKVADNVRYLFGTSGDIVNGATLWVRGRMDSANVFVIDLVVFPPRWVIATTQVAGAVADVGNDGSFKLNGTLVTTSPVTRYLGGSASQVVAGAWVIVTGRVSNGVLAADTIVFTDRRGHDACKAFKIEGLVYDYVGVDNFKLFGFTVNAANATFEGGVAGDLANGKVVQACGDELPVNGVLSAKKVEFKPLR